MKRPPFHHLTLGILFLGASNCAQAVLLSDFDGGGITYSEATVRTAPSGTILTGGPSGSFYRLLANVGDAGNYIAFDSEAGVDYTDWINISLKMDFNASAINADGWGVSLLPVADYGTTGTARVTNGGVDAGNEETPLLPNSFGVGFRTFNGTNSTISWNNAQISGDSGYGVIDGNWASMEIAVERNHLTKDAVVDLIVYDQTGQAGNAQNVFTNFPITNLTMEDFRVQIAGRTGGEAMNLDLDNIELEVEVYIDNDNDGLPDPWEIFYGLLPTDDGSTDLDNGPMGDPDMDNLNNAAEYDGGTNPVLADTDMDNLRDDYETLTGLYVSPTNTGTDPRIADTDGDDLEDGVENPTLPFVDASQPGTNPNIADTDTDGINDGFEILLSRNPTLIDPINPLPNLLADFDGNGVPFSESAVRTGPKGQLQINGVTDNYYQLLNNIGDAGNYIAFDSTDDFTGWSNISFQMDFLTENVAADGWAVNLLSTAVHGESGTVRMDADGVEEQALINNSFGVGFRTFNGTNSTISWNGALASGDVTYPNTQGVWSSVEINIDREPTTQEALVDVTMYDQTNLAGTASNIFTDFSVANFNIEDFRVQVAGRTGGSAMSLCIDNVKLFVTGPGQGDFNIVDIQKTIVLGKMKNPDTLSVTITWESVPGSVYGVYATNDLPPTIEEYDELDDDVDAEATGSVTSYTETGLPIDTTRRYYQIRLVN